jgi:hypothetical protein
MFPYCNNYKRFPTPFPDPFKIITPCRTQEWSWCKQRKGSALNTIGGRPVCTCQPGAHSKQIVPLLNSGHFAVVHSPRDYTDHCITSHIPTLSFIFLKQKKVPERRSGLRPSEKSSGTAFSHKNTPSYILINFLIPSTNYFLASWTQYALSVDNPLERTATTRCSLRQWVVFTLSRDAEDTSLINVSNNNAARLQANSEPLYLHQDRSCVRRT